MGGCDTYRSIIISRKLLDGSYVNITISPCFVTIKIYIAAVEQASDLQFFDNYPSFNIIIINDNDDYPTLFKLLQPCGEHIKGVVTAVISKQVKQAYNFINASSGVNIRWSVIVEPQSEKDTLLYEITYTTKHTNVIDKNTLDNVNKELKRMIDTNDKNNVVAGAEAVLV